MARHTALNAAALALFPWNVSEYPGRIRGLLTALGSRAMVVTVRDWRRGRRQTPVWALETIRAALDAKGEAIAHARALVSAELEKRNASRVP